MTTQEDLQIYNHSADVDVAAGPTRRRAHASPRAAAREDTTDQAAEVIPLRSQLGSRRGRPLTEADQPEGLSRPRFRSPWSEDDPSPRCVIRDYREGASLYGWWYWVPAALPLALNLIFWAGRHWSCRPAYFWAITLTVCLIAYFAFHAH